LKSPLVAELREKDHNALLQQLRGLQFKASMSEEDDKSYQIGTNTTTGANINYTSYNPATYTSANLVLNK
jgi:hypothetical protein